jgi:hypothetical protein
MKATIAAVIFSVFAMGCTFTPKHGDRGPASVGQATKAAGACEDSMSSKCDPNDKHCKK